MSNTNNKSSNQKKLIIWGTILVFIGLTAITVNYWLYDKNFINFLSVFGSVCSIAGLTLACYQIYKIKNITEETKEAVETNIESVNKYLTFSDISKIITIVDEIVIALQSERAEIAFLLLKELKDFLFELQCNDKVSDKISEELDALQDHVHKITIDIKSLDSAISKGKNIDYSKIRQNSEAIKETLVIIKSKLKYTEL